jgi:hypothetical protein
MSERPHNPAPALAPDPRADHAPRGAPPAGERPTLDAIHRDPARWLPRLRRLLDEHLAAARQLDRLSQAQSVAVRAGAADEVNDILTQREPLVRTLVSVSDELEPLAAYLARPANSAAARSPLTPVERSRIGAELAELDTLLHQIVSRDAIDQAALAAQRQALGAQLAGLGHTRDAASAYAPASQSPVFHDRQG